MQELFFRAGGRTFRGTVRHIDEIVHGGVAAFQRLRDGVPTESGAPPSAVVVCVGLGARFLGGIEDRTLKTVQIPVLKLKLPAVHSGRAFYNEEQSPIFFLVPLGGGIVSSVSSDFGQLTSNLLGGHGRRNYIRQLVRLSKLLLLLSWCTERALLEGRQTDSISAQ